MSLEHKEGQPDASSSPTIAFLGRTRLPHSNPKQSQDPNTSKFFQVDPVLEKTKSSSGPFDKNYKPCFKPERGIIHVYSINELCALEEPSVSDDLLMENVRSRLPVKSFWRLRAKNVNISNYANQNNPNNSHYSHFSGGNNGGSGNKNGRGGKYGVDETGLDSKSRRQRNRRRKSQAGGSVSGPSGRSGSFNNRHDNNLESDMELMELEQEMGSTGNSMQDFELWKSKMKALDRKKKGLPPTEQNDAPFKSFQPEVKKPDLMADFFSSNASEKPLSEELEPTLQNPNKVDNTKKSSSRFSSFFNEASGSPLTSSANLDRPTSITPENVHKHNAPASDKSKMMSLFKSVDQNETLQSSDSPYSLLTNNQQPRFNSPPGMDNSKNQQSTGQNNFFFENLLSKNKSEMQGSSATDFYSQPPTDGHSRTVEIQAHRPPNGSASQFFPMNPAQQMQNQAQHSQNDKPRVGGGNQTMPYPNMYPMMYGMPPPQFMQNGMPPQGMPPQGMSPQGMPSQGMPPQGMPLQGMPPQRMGMPPQGMGMPPRGMGMPPQGMGMPPQGMAQNGIPFQGMPSRNMPPNGLPQFAPNQMMPQHHSNKGTQ